MLQLTDGGGHRLLLYFLASLLPTPLCLAHPASEEVSADPAVASGSWLNEVALLITEEERRGFSSLEHDYQREAFVELFWQVRDLLPETRKNEFRDIWYERWEMADQRFGQVADDRAYTMLLAGPPREIFGDLCPHLLSPTEIWHYEKSREFTEDTYLVFVARDGEQESRWRNWRPREGIESLGLAADDDLARECARGRELEQILDAAIAWDELLSNRLLVPQPSTSWVARFLERTTDMVPGRDTLEATLRLEFPGRHQNRTVVQGLITVPNQVGEPGDSENPAFNLQVTGDVLRREELFDNFLYRFEVPVAETNHGQIPMAFQRHLLPGDYDLILKIEDLHSGRLYHTEQQIHVPAITAASSPSTDSQLAEANAVLNASDHMVKIMPPPDELLIGKFRVEARTAGDGIAKVTFVLNGRTLMSKTRPPFSLEIDLGHAPRLHTLEAIALNAAGQELARDSILLNGGPHRFAVRLVEPEQGKRYVQSLRAAAEIDLPAGEHLDHVDFYLNETRLASLYQPPYVQPIQLPQDRHITYVRTVAYLDDGNSTEDLVFINTSNQMHHLRINMVELFTTVSDRQGHPVEGLASSDFTVLEEGEPQVISRFERVRDLSIHAGVIVDTSTSMTEELDEATKAALKFFDNVLRPKDRAAVVVFNDEPLMKVPFTNNMEILAGGLADLTSEGETALYDTLVFTLYYFAGIKGKRALILLSDGQDSHSRHSFEEALDFARRSGVAIYTVGLGFSSREIEVRNILQRLARETAGRAFFIDRARELDSIYAAIEEELRSQYLIAYQSTHEQGGEFRRVEVKIDQPGLKAKTIPGYYP